jgi:long-chain acyl-CoA synthetase
MHVAHFVHRSAQRWPDRPLWLGVDFAISYREGAARLNRIARQLLQRGRRGDRVAILSVNRFEAFEAYLAAMNAGMAAVPLNPKLHAKEIAYMIADSGARFVVFSPEYEAALQTVRAELPDVAHWVRIGEGTADESTLVYSELLEGSDNSPPEVDIPTDSLAWLFYTSGTTGKPKGAMETHRNLVTMVQQFLLGILRDACETDVMLHTAPIAHGTASVGLAHLAVGAAQSFPTSTGFDPAHIFGLVEKLKVTSSFLAPTMVQMLLQSPERERFDISSLKNIVYGGGPMYVELLKQALAGFGPVFHQIYGQGEAPMTCAAMPKWEHRTDGDAAMTRRLASAGREMPAVMIRIVDDDDRPLGANEAGEIVVRGDLVMSGYWNQPEASAETLRGGWLHTGDIGHLDEHGYLYITDRKKDLIISGGSNIYPREIEEVLLQHAAVSEACVVGVPDNRWGEAVKAVVVLRPDAVADESALIAFCQERIASYKKPKSIEFVSALPKSAYGKVLKRELRDRYWVGKGRSV